VQLRPVSLYFDTELKRRPDIVANLFSDQYAQFFCHDADECLNPLWKLVHYGMKSHDVVTRFLDYQRRKRIYVDEKIEDWFTDAIDKTSVLIERLSRLFLLSLATTIDA